MRSSCGRLVAGREVKSFPLSPGKKFDGGGVSPDGKWVALAERQSDSKVRPRQYQSIQSICKFRFFLLPSI